MITIQMHKNINEASFTYLVLAKQMIQQDMVAAMYCLGITEEKAKLIAQTPPAQFLKLPAESNCYANN